MAIRGQLRLAELIRFMIFLKSSKLSTPEANSLGFGSHKNDLVRESYLVRNLALRGAELALMGLS
jgi:hypothetical protein